MRQYGAALAHKHGLSRRAFFKTACGHGRGLCGDERHPIGPLYDVSRAEAADTRWRMSVLTRLSKQFIMDMHTHFLRDDTRLTGFVSMREAVGKAQWNPALVGKPQSLDDLKFANYFKEIFLDSDTKVACLSGAPSDVPEDWFLTNEMKAAARAKINQEAGTRRMLSHAIFTPGQPGWLEQVDRAIAGLKPDSFKGYTIGDNTHKELSKYPWRMDDEQVVYPFYERCLKAGLVNICVHKGLFPPSVAEKFPHLLAHSDVRMWGRQHKTGRSSTSLSIIQPTASVAACRMQRGPNSRKPGVSNGSMISPRFQRNMVSSTSTVISARSSPSQPWPIRNYVRP